MSALEAQNQDELMITSTRLPPLSNDGDNLVIPSHILPAGTVSRRLESNTGFHQIETRDPPIPQHDRLNWRPAILQFSCREGQGHGTSNRTSTTLTRSRASSLPTRVDGPNIPARSARRQTRDADLPPSSLPGQSRRYSYTSGSPDILSALSRAGSSTISQHDFHDFARGPVDNSFESRSNVVSWNPSFEWSSDSVLKGSEADSTTIHEGSTVDFFSARHSLVTSPEPVYLPPKTRPRKGTLESVVDKLAPDSLQKMLTRTIPNHANQVRRSSLLDVYEKTKTRGVQLQRNKWVQIGFEYGIYIFLLSFVYFVLVGLPLWKGAVYWLWWVVANKFVFAGGFGITLGLALFYAFAPLLIFFEKNPPDVDYSTETKISQGTGDTALLIPCYKSAKLIGATLEAAFKIFPPSNVFVIANGNSPTPLDEREEICRPYGVNHVWSPIGCKLVAQFVGCYAAKGFKNVLLIDDDCALPANFPVVTDRLRDNVYCIGYTIKSVGPNSFKGNLCQQAQDLEYRLSGLQRDFAGRVGSATFPHEAISLWDRSFLIKTFNEHLGFSVSEDWFFGHVARELGSRIQICSEIFVETETPTDVFFPNGGSRGGFGEMTIFKQRFKRWNVFFVHGMWYNMAYIFCSWKLGWWEIGAKIFVFQEVYETLLYLLTPFIFLISFYVRPSFCGILLGTTIVMYLLNVIIFNEVHLRRKNERLGWVVVYVYYLPYKIVLTGINVASCYGSLWKYTRYFARRHPKVTEDEKAIEVVVRLEEAATAQGIGRRLTVCIVGSDDSAKGDPENNMIEHVTKKRMSMSSIWSSLGGLQGSTGTARRSCSTSVEDGTNASWDPKYSSSASSWGRKRRMSVPEMV